MNRFYAVFILFVQFGSGSQSESDKILSDYFQAVGGVEKWGSFSVVKEEMLSWGNINVYNTKKENIISDLKPTKCIKEIRLPFDGIMKYFSESGDLQTTFKFDKYGTKMIVAKREFDSALELPIPMSLKIMKWREEGELEYHKFSTFMHTQYHVLKRYNKTDNSWSYYYFNPNTHLLDFFHKNLDIKIYSMLAEYTEHNGVRFPRVQKTFRVTDEFPEGVLFFKKRITTITFQ